VRPRAKVTAYKKSKKSIGTKMNDLDICLEVVLSSWLPLPNIRRWISRKPLKIGYVPKEHEQEMAYELSNGHVTDDITWQRKVKLETPNTLRAQYLQNGWW